jgi:futalosine hydrolase
MKILIVAATRAELSVLFNAFKLPQQDFVETAAFDILITGVGMTATAFALGRHLFQTYELVLNLGIAGSFNRNIPLGSVLQIDSDEFSEFGAEDKQAFLPIDQLGFGRGKYYSRYPGNNPAVQKLKKVYGITVNKVHGNAASIAEIISRLNPDTESMEGAAVFYCAEKANLNVLQIRSISNYVEERNRDNWKIGQAIKELNSWVLEFLTQS